ncbi:MAG: hypothetical protein ACLR7Z_13220 [Bilophila wadsworthia]
MDQVSRSALTGGRSRKNGRKKQITSQLGVVIEIWFLPVDSRGKITQQTNREREEMGWIYTAGLSSPFGMPYFKHLGF